MAGSAGSKEKISSGSAPKEVLAKYMEEYGSVQSPQVVHWSGVGERKQECVWKWYDLLSFLNIRNRKC